MQTDKLRLSQRLTGKAGVGLASFHLGRLGHDFLVTNDNCDHGDLWVRFDDRLEIVEVKTVSGWSWSVGRSQQSRVDWYVFVNLTDADCWLLKSSAITPKLDATKAASVSLSCKDLTALGATPLHRATPSLLLKQRLPRKAAGVRKVKKRLASGEIKTYEYRY